MASTDRRNHWMSVLFPEDVDFPGKTEGLIVPSGFTAQRPTSPVNGLIRYNLSSNALEGYINSSWTDIGVIGGGGGGASTFTGLTDTPSNYSGLAGRLLRVNLAQTAIEAIDGSIFYVPITGGTMSPSANLNFSGGGQVLGLPTVPSPTGAASKEYVDSIAAGLDPKESVRVATTGNITLAGTPVVDGVSTNNGDRILVKDQASAINNGIYIVTAGAWSRSSDMDGSPSNEVSGGNFTFVEQGTLNGGSAWVVLADGQVNVGIDPMNWTAIGGALSFPLQGPNQTAGAPTYSFASATDAGMYYTGSGVSISYGGTPRLNLTSSGVVAVGKFQAPDGLVTQPTYTFSGVGGQGSGMYYVGGNVIGVASGGSDLVRFSTSGGGSLLVEGQGSNGIPAITRIGDSNTGFYFPGANGEVGITGNGVTFVEFNSSVSNFENVITMRGPGNVGGTVRFKEGGSNGDNYVAFKAPDSLTGNTTWELPPTDGSVGQVLQTDGFSTLSWASQPYDIAGSVIGVPAVTTNIFRLAVPRPFTLAPGAPASVGIAMCDSATTASGSSAVFEVHLVGPSTSATLVPGAGTSPATVVTPTLIGTINYAPGTVAATIVEIFPPGTLGPSTPVAMPVGHELVVHYATADGGGTLGNISFSWEGQTP